MSTLYHYCTAETFVSILSNKSIWLSSLNLSNDTMEGKVLFETLSRLANNDKLSAEEFKYIEDAIAFLESTFHGLGFCLSLEGDLLSQWRGYANDGNGFSIGFNSKYFEELIKHDKDGGKATFTIDEAKYKNDEHNIQVKPLYEEIKEAAKELKSNPKHSLASIALLGTGAVEEERLLEENRKHYKKAYSKLLGKVMLLFPKLYTLKRYAFHEEREWRLISYLIGDKDNSCEFRAIKNRIIPYRAHELPSLESEPILKIYIGPKNITPTSIVKAFVAKHGYNEVEVERSTATYR